MATEPTVRDWSDLLPVAVRAAHAGGAVVARHFAEVPAGLRAKAPGDYVSEVDTRSEDVIRSVLAEDAPDLTFFGEEGGGERGRVGWLVDPLDGTANFLHRFPVVGVSVALVADGRPVVGVVHAPLLGDTYTAVRGAGAWRGTDRLAVSTRTATTAICATGFPFRRKDLLPRYLATFDAVLHRVEDLRRPGSAALDLAWVAAGVFDGFFELALGPWDVAAGALLVEEAGGRVTDWAGDDQAWLDTGDIVAAPPAVHEELLALTRLR
jgi:myo-inositol-1(or 4)-monophosphatase